MTRSNAIEILSLAHPTLKDLVVEYVQESDHQDGDGYWETIEEETLLVDFALYIASIG